MRAVIFGPGRIGCGLAGQLLHASGYDVVFVGRGPIVSNLARTRRYGVRLVDGRDAQEVVVRGVRALATSEEASVAAAVAGADLVAVSVGPAGLAEIAPLLAAGLLRRAAPVNVIAFENGADPGARLRDALLRVAPTLGGAGHGFSGGLVSRIVTRRLGDPAGAEPLVFLADPPETFVVHGPSLCAALPAVRGLRAVDDYGASLAKKLYTFSAGHAAAAYLGALKGYRYVHAAVRDPEIRRAVRAAMEEGRRGLARRYGPALAGDRAELEEILRRFDNAALADPVLRVGRDPLRKLGGEDRLVGAARLAVEAGVRPRRLALAAAAALCFHQAAERASRPETALREASGLDPARGLGRDVVATFALLAAGREPDNVLLRLAEPVWSWARATRAPAPRRAGAAEVRAA